MTDNMYMQMALDIAKKGKGFVDPNPLVGAVIVKNNKVISTGYHEVFGGPHAEVNAINNAEESVEDSTLYVNLEPCSHYGKTPPCATLIIKKKIKRVVIGSLDPNPLVSGKGVKLLKDAGIDVSTHILDEKNKQLNRVFFKYITTKRPYVILKTAMTLDGKIATYKHHSKWITNEISREKGHDLRHALTGIMVGINTVIYDNPLLTCRRKQTPLNHPVRIIVDSTLKIPLKSKILTTAQTFNTLILTTNESSKTKEEQISQTGAKVIRVPNSKGKVNLTEAMKILGQKNINSILLEGGGTLNFSMLYAGLVDEVMAFIAPKIIGGKDALSPVEGRGVPYMDQAINLIPQSTTMLDDDILITYQVQKEDN